VDNAIEVMVIEITTYPIRMSNEFDHYTDSELVAQINKYHGRLDLYVARAVAELNRRMNGS